MPSRAGGSLHGNAPQNHFASALAIASAALTATTIVIASAVSTAALTASTLSISTLAIAPAALARWHYLGRKQN